MSRAMTSRRWRRHQAYRRSSASQKINSIKLAVKYPPSLPFALQSYEFNCCLTVFLVFAQYSFVIRSSAPFKKTRCISNITYLYTNVSVSVAAVSFGVFSGVNHHQTVNIITPFGATGDTWLLVTGTRWHTNGSGVIWTYPRHLLTFLSALI